MNVHEFDKDIPTGKTLVAEPRDIGAADRRYSETVLASKIGWGRTKVELVAGLAGWACAGSMMRWDNGCYAVRWEDNRGSRHGSRYREYADAKAHFDRIPEGLA